MKIPYGWVREFAPLTLSAGDAADRLVNAGIEVASVTRIATTTTAASRRPSTSQISADTDNTASSMCQRSWLLVSAAVSP